MSECIASAALLRANSTEGTLREVEGTSNLKLSSLIHSINNLRDETNDAVYAAVEPLPS
jgi:hypothetical protein